MKKNDYFQKISILSALLALLTVTLACGLPSGQNPLPASTEKPAGEMPAPSATGQGTGSSAPVGICEAIPTAEFEQVMGRPLTGAPMPFQDPALGDGCAYDFGNDGTAAYFAYVTFAGEAQFNDALASAVQAEPVTTLGDSAFLNYGPDARQLWIRAGDRAVLIAIGDRENVAGMLTLAPYLLAALP